MSAKEMETLTINGQEFEVVDDTARSSIGTLSNLTTTEKGSVVGAINEVIEDFDADLATHTANISALNSGKVSKTRDTMTNFLRFQSNNITDGLTPSESAWGMGISGRDSGGSTVIMQVQPVDYDGGGKYIYLSRSATYGGTRKTASLQIGFNDSGDQQVVVSSAGAWRDALGAVSKSGDTMTGSLSIKESGIDSTVTHTSHYWGTTKQFNIVDKNGIDLGHFRSFVTADDRQGIYLEAQRTVNGSSVSNYLRLAIDGSGNKSVMLDSAVWRSAILAISNKTLTNCTTNNTGEVNLGLTTSNSAVLGCNVVGGSNYYICIPFVYNNYWYVRILDNSGGRLTSTNVGNITAYYISM